MSNAFTVRLHRTELPSHLSQAGDWVASVDIAPGVFGHNFIAKTPQLALAGLAVYWSADAARMQRGPDATPVHVLDLSVRAENCLRAGNINTLGDLRHVKDSVLFRIPYMGRKTVKEIRDKLAAWDAEQTAPET